MANQSDCISREAVRLMTVSFEKRAASGAIRSQRTMSLQLARELCHFSTIIVMTRQVPFQPTKDSSMMKRQCALANRCLGDAVVIEDRCLPVGRWRDGVSTRTGRFRISHQATPPSLQTHAQILSPPPLLLPHTPPVPPLPLSLLSLRSWTAPFESIANKRA